MILAGYGYHDSSVCLKDGDNYFVYEFERFVQRRYAVLTQHFPFPHQVATDEEFLGFFDHIRKQHGIKEVEVFYYHELYPCDFEKIRTLFDVKNFVRYDHHYAHAVSVYRQSSFDDCYIISYDGNGLNKDDSMSSFTVWQAKDNKVFLLHDFQRWESYSLGNCYIALSGCLSSIKSLEPLSRPGKLMGFSGYGRVVEDWKPYFEKFFDGGLHEDWEELCQNLNMPLAKDSLTGQTELDFAATIQWAFENKFFKIFKSLGIPTGSNLCVTGGCALNIPVNQRLFELGYNVYVSPVSGDCGLTIGIAADHYADKSVDITYQGFDVLDKGYRDSAFTSRNVNLAELAKLLCFDKKVIGYVRGRSEVGPRALGNRSILCYPDIAGIKDRLNAEIKFREWYRPFGAICKLDSLAKYFENACESPYMNFCPTLKCQYRFDSISHIDQTCRIQTVSREQNQEMYDLLTEMENLGAVGILLNTSFNIKGQPILTRLKNAFDSLHQTKLDGFYYEGNYFSKDT